ncbi:eukaryotic translation initiation factor 2-alpha kinase 4, partial [Phenoliferia sp. Uapishka_3]
MEMERTLQEEEIEVLKFAKREELRIAREKGREGEEGVDAVLLEDRTVPMRVRIGDATGVGAEGGQGEVEEKEVVVKLGVAISGDWLGRSLPSEIFPTPISSPLPSSAQVFDILAPYFLTSQGLRKLQKVTSDLSRLTPLRHPSLHIIYGYYLTPYSPSFLPTNPFSASSNGRSQNRAGHTLIVLESPRTSPTLQSILGSCGELRTDKALSIFGGVVIGVEFLHGKGMVHRAVGPKNVLVGEGGEVKICNAAWWQRLRDLNKSDQWVVGGQEEELSDAWICPEARDDGFVYDRSRDMWDVGVLLAQMLFGLDVAQRYSSPGDLIRGMSHPSTTRKILHDLLLTDSKKRPTASKLLVSLLESSRSETSSHHSQHHQQPTTLSTTPQNHTYGAFMRQHQQPTTPMFSPNHQVNMVSKSADTGQGQSGFFWQPRPSGSRYRNAVKKIRLPNVKANEEKILREVTIWSRMNHPNIVRYHTSWVETDENPSNLDTDGESSTQLTGTETGSNLPTSSDDDSSSAHSDDPSEFDSDSDDDHLAPGHELDIDLGLEEFDDDFLSVGHSKSISYPSIHFGNEEDEASTAANSPVVGRSERATRVNSPANAGSPGPRYVRTLYIQMEYVEKLTLKEAIEDGESEVDSWKHMFQILSAMLHFTSLNIIHRDLKPSNIFLDVKGDVRIGDFGLAVNQNLADSVDALLSIESSMDDVDLTSGVGTSLYIAPETLSRGRNDRSVKYSNKIDMYSLGIVFFEFWHPFKTGMERIQVLRELRKPEIIFPPTWDAVKLARHTKIVQRCLVHDPELRASPKDLLHSDLLPPRVGDDSIEETIRLLSHSGTPHAQTLITALFNQTDEDRLRKDFSYDFYDGEGAKVDNDPYGEIVRDKLSRIFRQKGAVCMDSPLLMPHSQIYASRKPVRLLDADGTVVCLPFQLNIPFCRMVARDTALTRLKRWTIAPVYRTSTAGGQPRAVLNAAFDIVSDAVTAASEAECIYVVEELMAAFPFAGETAHIINHSKILDLVVDKVPKRQRSAVLDVLVQHGRLQRIWTKTAAELMKIPGVTKPIVDEMGTFDFYGSIEEVKSRILAAAPRLKHLAQEAFDELQEIVSLARHLGVKEIKFAPLLATNWDFHRDGALFEAHHVKGKFRDVIAAGGRFDDVVSRLAAPDIRHSGRLPHVVGVSISVAKLSLAASESNAVTSRKISAMKEANRTYGSWAVRRCDVYVVSFAPNLIERRLDVVKDLWKAGIKADLMYDDDLITLTPEQLVNACRREGILWLVMVKPGADRALSGHELEKTLKVKSVLRGVEDEVPRSELTAFIIKEQRDQAIVDERFSVATGVVVEQQVDLASLGVDFPRSTQEFFPILIDGDVRHKGKHKQRTMIIQRAQKNVETAVAAASEAPVFAVDVDGQAFKSMAHSTAWVSDDEAYRLVVQSAPPSKRDYLNNIRYTIRKHQAPSLSFWLFSLRDDRSVLLTFPDNL